MDQIFSVDKYYIFFFGSKHQFFLSSKYIFLVDKFRKSCMLRERDDVLLKKK